MVLLLDINDHAVVAIMAIFVIFSKMAAPIIAIDFKLLWLFLALLQRMAKMQISSEDGIKKYALYTKLWPKIELDQKYGRILCILRSFWLENGPSRVGTSHVSSELILTFLESGEQGEWD